MIQTTVVPGVVLKTRFVTPEQSDFKNYVDYVDRDEAKKEFQANNKLFSLYQDYMDNPDKTSSLFTEKTNRLSSDDKKQLKRLFKTAQENESIMWQDVISFDNKWLEEQGLYDSKTHTIDENKLMDVTRAAMKEMMKKERLDQSAVWSGAIHYNTDNIHIHIATVEPNPTRDRGKRKPKTLDAMKSKVVNNILDRGEEQKIINDLIRKEIVDKKKSDSTLRWRNREMKPMFLKIYNQLPEDKRQWQYSYTTINHLKPSLNQLTEKYIEKYHKKDYELFLKKLDKEVDVLKRAYGEGKFDKKRYENYKENKIEELYKRMGNAFLKEMKEYDRMKNKGKPTYSFNKKGTVFKNKFALQYAMKKMERAFSSEYDSWKNQRHYENLQRDIERAKEMEMER
ncbi:hypothetical protein AC623_20390 [Bacillus sp. FJAT-27231]|uniref:MobP2 family relaxase n=1 Tax=Bacillus sp. FJAT-27231 TaxID=1679168 RepID=UPI0006713E6A|nr:MobP2 family relaxase [Bacillus sp. FJAT-27231]KMY52504.1 hypothetical protein AC623_20390 [Bacillus sp. FJAT-27231]